MTRCRSVSYLGVSEDNLRVDTDEAVVHRRLSFVFEAEKLSRNLLEADIVSSRLHPA